MAKLLFRTFALWPSRNCCFGISKSLCDAPTIVPLMVHVAYDNYMPI